MTPRPQRPPQPRRQGLGPKQLAWLREHVAPFAVMEKQALAAQAHREAVREKLIPTLFIDKDMAFDNVTEILGLVDLQIPKAVRKRVEQGK